MTSLKEYFKPNYVKMYVRCVALMTCRAKPGHLGLELLICFLLEEVILAGRQAGMEGR